MQFSAFGGRCGLLRASRNSRRLRGRMVIGKTDAALNKGASGTISIYSGTDPAALTDTGDNITAYNRFGNIASGKWVAVWTMPWGFECKAAEC
jgi:hypothetical protein